MTASIVSFKVCLEILKPARCTYRYTIYYVFVTRMLKALYPHLQLQIIYFENEISCSLCRIVNFGERVKFPIFFYGIKQYLSPKMSNMFLHRTP